jgi:Ferroportin1 (FPN1)
MVEQQQQQQQQQQHPQDAAVNGDHETKRSNGNRWPRSIVDEKTPLTTKSSTTTTYDNDDDSANDAHNNNDSRNNNNNNNNNIISILNYARRLIYVSHAFSQFSEVAWQFSLILFLAAFTQYKSMILVSTYGMLSWMAVCLFGATAGRFVDGTNRLVAARRFIWCENLAVVLATLLCYRLLLLQQQWRGDDDGDDDDENNNDSSAAEEDYNDSDNASSSSSSSSSWLHGVPTDRHSLLLLLGIHFFGPLAMLLDKGFLVSMERDWVVVMSEQAAAQGGAVVVVVATNNNDNSSDDHDDHHARKTKHANVTAAQARWLSTTNVVMKQIDLTCQIIGPAVVGFVIAAFDSTGGGAPNIQHDDIHNNNNNNTTRSASTDLTGAVLLVGFVNIAALVVEYICTARVYHLIPALAIKRDAAATAAAGASSSSLSLSPLHSRTLSETNDSNSQGGEEQEEEEDLSGKPRIIVAATRNGNTHDQNDSMVGCGISRQIRHCCSGGGRGRGRRRQQPMEATWHGFRRQFLPAGLRIYFKQRIAWGGVGLSLLYLNCLTFGGLMTAYLVWKGMPFETVGIWRGISSALGLSGTVAYHASVRKTTLVNTGMWSIVLEFICLSLCFASFLVPDYTISVAMLIAGVCFSRVGLWVFDITIAQLMQEFIPENVRGVVGGTQQSINAFFQLGSFALGLIFPDPRDFWIYALAGYIAIALAMLFYFFGVFIHAPRFLTTAEKTSRSTAATAISI